MRVALSLHGASMPSFRVLLCLPHDVPPEAALDDLDVVAETLRWSVDDGVELGLEAVWLDGDRGPTLDSWLAALE